MLINEENYVPCEAMSANSFFLLKYVHSSKFLYFSWSDPKIPSALNKGISNKGLNVSNTTFIRDFISWGFFCVWLSLPAEHGAGATPEEKEKSDRCPRCGVGAGPAPEEPPGGETLRVWRKILHLEQGGFGVPRIPRNEGQGGDLGREEQPCLPGGFWRETGERRDGFGETWISFGGDGETLFPYHPPHPLPCW